MNIKSRMRRLRASEVMRDALSQTSLQLSSLIMPVFVYESDDLNEGPVPISSMPGIFRYDLQSAVPYAKKLYSKGIKSILIFGIPARKTPSGYAAWAEDGVVQKTVRAIKEACPELYVIADVCLCAYTDHGHCGLIFEEDADAYNIQTEDKLSKMLKKLDETYESTDTLLEAGNEEYLDQEELKPGYGGEEKTNDKRNSERDVPENSKDLPINDLTCSLLAKIAVSLAEAGVDAVSPSAMMDGQVKAIRKALDTHKHATTAILSLSSKFASAFYSPFRTAVDSAPHFGDRSGYQLEPSNADAAIRESIYDEEEGADILCVKPALPYLDILAELRSETRLPLAAYHVSGEYAMIKAAVNAGGCDEQRIVLECFNSIKRAGADLIISYYAEAYADWRAEGLLAENGLKLK